MKKELICKVSDRWMDSLESAHLSVTSPSGGNRTLDKIKTWDRKHLLTKEDFKVVHEIRDLVTEQIQTTGKVRLTYDIPLTIDQLKRFDAIVKLADMPKADYDNDIDPAGGYGLYSHV
jgi:hypothetical protein